MSVPKMTSNFIFEADKIREGVTTDILQCI